MENGDQRLYSRYSSPFGRSWEDWVAIWWQWCSSEPDENNPAADTTGVNCNRNQNDPHAWFLAGTFGGKAVRHCIIPKTKAIFFPIITNRISYAEHGYLKSEIELAKYAKADLDSAEIYEAYVDDVKLKCMEICRVRTGVFKFSVPNGQFVSKDSETFQAISDGYWVFLKPLPQGEHTIIFVGQNLKYDEVYLKRFKGERPIFRVDVKYLVSIL